MRDLDRRQNSGAGPDGLYPHRFRILVGFAAVPSSPSCPVSLRRPPHLRRFPQVQCQCEACKSNSQRACPIVEELHRRQRRQRRVAIFRSGRFQAAGANAPAAAGESNRHPLASPITGTSCTPSPLDSDLHLCGSFNGLRGVLCPPQRDNPAGPVQAMTCLSQGLDGSQFNQHLFREVVYVVHAGPEESPKHGSS